MSNSSSHRTAHQNFFVINQTTLPLSRSSLITEISFQENDDIPVCLQKLLLQDQISSCYLSSQISLIQESNKLISFQTFSNQIEQNLANEENLMRAMAFWDSLIESEGEVNEKEVEYQTFMRKFIKVCSIPSNYEILLSLFRELLKSDRIFWDSYVRDESKQNFLHSEEIKLACEKNLKQIEIESLVNLHMKRLEELETMYRDNFARKQEQKKQEFRAVIGKLYSESGGNNQEFTSTGNFFNDSMGNLSVKSDEISGSNKETKKNQSVNTANNPITNNNAPEVIKVKKEKKFEIRLCLGTQKKYEFRVKLKEGDFRDWLFLNEEKIGQNLTKSANQLRNYIFGIEQSALLNLISLKQEEGKLFEKSMKFKTDLFFTDFPSQILTITQELQGFNPKKTPLVASKPTFSFSNGDILVTKHGNIKPRVVFSVVYEAFSDFQSDSFLDWFGKILRICNENQIKSLVIPLELFFAGTLNNFYTIKNYGDVFMKIIQTVKREMNGFALEYAVNHFTKNVVILVPKNENLKNLFERSKEMAKNAFE